TSYPSLRARSARFGRGRPRAGGAAAEHGRGWAALLLLQSLDRNPSPPGTALYHQAASTTLPRHIGTSARTHARHRGHRVGAASRWARRRRTSGSVGQGGGLLRRGFIFELAQVLEEGEGDHREQGVMMQAVPRSAFEVVEPEFFLHLLVRLLARPASL